MDESSLIIIFFPYGLAFFCMGLVVLLEYGRASDPRLRLALRPLAVFGLLHGAHEWFEMFVLLGVLPGGPNWYLAWESLRIALLAFSFLSLSAFGASMLVSGDAHRRISLFVPLAMVSIWAFGLLFLRGSFYVEGELWNVADVWTRYVLGIPAAIIASVGLIVQQRAFRQAGLTRFSRDSLWAAVAFAWYGVVGQAFTRQSLLPPSTVINQQLFLELFGFPVQLLRAAAAVVIAVFVMRFLRSFEIEIKRQISELQQARLEEAQKREALRGDLLRRVVAAQEAERQRIARELHDETGQALTAIGLGLRGISSTLRQDLDKSAHNLRQLEGLVIQSLEELQRLISDLRPSHLDELGLPAALRWYAGEIENRARLHVDVEIHGEPEEIPSSTKIAAFRVAQEALTNVVKHANAKYTHIRLIYNNKSVTVEVEDDGCGFDAANLSAFGRTAWGILGMNERATLLGGEFQLESQPGQGTRVRVVLPLKEIGEEENGNPIDAG